MEVKAYIRRYGSGWLSKCRPRPIHTNGCTRHFICNRDSLWLTG